MGIFVRMWVGHRSYEVITQRRRMREAKELFYGLINCFKEIGSVSVYERNMPLMRASRSEISTQDMNL